MLTEHANFIASATDGELKKVRKDLEELLPVLRETDVRTQTRTLLRAIDQEMLERIMRAARLARSVTGAAPKALKAA